MTNSEDLTHADCLDSSTIDNDCEGTTEYRMPLSGTGRSFARCDRHWSERLDTQSRLSRDYGIPFDPGYNGYADEQDDY